MKSIFGWQRGPQRAQESGTRDGFAFVLAQPGEPDAAVAALFRRAFRSAPPREPFHFVAYPREGGAPAAYVHYTEHKPGVFLCGGLCVDARVYRRLSGGERESVSRQGSVSRWLLARSIEALPRKQAVFAFTGNIQSGRDVLALGFVKVAAPHLFVQWHACAVDARAARVAEVAALGPF